VPSNIVTPVQLTVQLTVLDVGLVDTHLAQPVEVQGAYWSSSGSLQLRKVTIEDHPQM